MDRSNKLQLAALASACNSHLQAEGYNIGTFAVVVATAAVAAATAAGSAIVQADLAAIVQAAAAEAAAIQQVGLADLGPAETAVVASSAAQVDAATHQRLEEDPARCLDFAGVVQTIAEEMS